MDVKTRIDIKAMYLAPMGERGLAHGPIASVACASFRDVNKLIRPSNPRVDPLLKLLISRETPAAASALARPKRYAPPPRHLICGKDGTIRGKIKDSASQPPSPKDSTSFALEPQEIALAGMKKIYTIDVRDGAHKWHLVDGNGENVSKLHCTASTFVWGINVNQRWIHEHYIFDVPSNLAIKTGAGAFGITGVKELRALTEIDALLISVGTAPHAKHLLMDCPTGKIRCLTHAAVTFYRGTGTDDWRDFINHFSKDGRSPHGMRKLVGCPPNAYYFSAVNELQELIVEKALRKYGEIERIDYGITPNDTSKNYVMRANGDLEQEALILLDFLTTPRREQAWQGMFNRQPCVEMPSVYGIPFWRFMRYGKVSCGDEISKAIYINELVGEERVSGITAALQELLHTYTKGVRQLLDVISAAVPTTYLNPQAYEELLKKRHRSERELVKLMRCANLAEFQENYSNTVRKLAMGEGVSAHLRETLLFYADIFDVYEDAHFQPRANGVEREYADVWVPHKDVAIVYGCARTEEEKACFDDMCKKFAARGIWLFEWDKDEPRDKSSVHARFRKERALRKKWLASHKLNEQHVATADRVAGVLGGYARDDKQPKELSCGALQE